MPAAITRPGGCTKGDGPFLHRTEPLHLVKKANGRKFQEGVATGQKHSAEVFFM